MADFHQEAGSEHENKAVTVLVVEDEAMMRTKLAEELQDAGYLVVEASDGTEAVEILRVSSGLVTFAVLAVRSGIVFLTAGLLLSYLLGKAEILTQAFDLQASEQVQHTWHA